MPVMLAYQNLADDADDLTATREATGLGVRNLLTESVAEVWRVPTVAAATVTDLDISLSAAAEVGVIALFAPRDGYLPPGYTVQVFGSAVSIGASDVLAVAATAMSLSDNRGAWWHWPDAAVTLRYLRLRFTAVSGDEYLQLGRLWIGPDIRPGYAAQDGYQRGTGDAGQVERAAISGIVSASRGATYRAHRLILPMLTDTETDQVEAMALAAGITRQVVVNARTQRGAKDLILGRLASMPSPRPVSPTRYAADIAVMEDL